MGKITSITSSSKYKNRCDIYVDGELKASVTLETVIKSRLKVGMEISESELSVTVKENENGLALNKAASYVEKSFKTKKQVVDYLKGKGFSDTAVYYAVDKLKEYGYIDDVEYAKRYLESTRLQGKRLSDFKLMTKGISKKDIEKAFDQTDIDMEAKAFALAEKHFKNKEKTPENFSKTFRYLIGKGFSYEEAESAISRLKEVNDGEDTIC